MSERLIICLCISAVICALILAVNGFVAIKTYRLRVEIKNTKKSIKQSKIK